MFYPYHLSIENAFQLKDVVSDLGRDCDEYDYDFYYSAFNYLDEISRNSGGVVDVLGFFINLEHAYLNDEEDFNDLEELEYYLSTNRNADIIHINEKEKIIFFIE